MSKLLVDNPYRYAVEKALQALFPGVGAESGLEKALPVAGDRIPQPLYNAMGYSLLAPGKRVRPVLLLASYHLLRDDWEKVLPFACALEMIHSYSLIHDDLPALDNDDLRRGRPTNHKVFGENMAILAGDGLLNLAYETMLRSPFALAHPAEGLSAAGEIAFRAGVCGMIAGQTLDVCLEGSKPEEAPVRYIHAHKTGDLLTAPVAAGLMLAGANPSQLAEGENYGQSLGRAFQIQDDLLDLYGDPSLLGKNVGMDAAMNKNTWPGVFGVEQSQKDVEDAFSEAVASLGTFGDRAAFLKDYTYSLLDRNY